MNTGFRCECCGRKMSLSFQDGLTAARCPHCGKQNKIPTSLAGMPHPRVAPGVIDGIPVAEGDLVGACAVGHCDEPDDSVVARTMPWILSVLLHLGVGVIMAFLAMLTIPVKARPLVYIPELVDVKGDTETLRIGFDGTGNLSSEPAHLVPQAAPEQVWQKYTETQMPTIDSLSTGPVNLRRPVGPDGGKTGTFPPGTNRKPPIFDPPPPGRGRADHVVFVIDRSGSMVTTFDMVRLAMYERIGGMEPNQQFHVILYASGDVQENPPRRLVWATNDRKVALVDFLDDVRPRNQTDPVPALGRAFAVMRAGRQGAARRDDKPPTQLIYLLSDGEFPKNDPVLAAIRKLNPAGDGQVHVNTILYGTRPPEAEKVMKMIARENKGCYKYTSPDE